MHALQVVRGGTPMLAALQQGPAEAFRARPATLLTSMAGKSSGAVQGTRLPHSKTGPPLMKKANHLSSEHRMLAVRRLGSRPAGSSAAHVPLEQCKVPPGMSPRLPAHEGILTADAEAWWRAELGEVQRYQLLQCSQAGVRLHRLPVAQHQAAQGGQTGQHPHAAGLDGDAPLCKHTAAAKMRTVPHTRWRRHQGYEGNNQPQITWETNAELLQARQVHQALK